MVDAHALEHRLRALIRDVPDFPRPGIVFRDITTLVADPEGFRDAVDAMAAQWRGSSVTAVAGIESRGFILGGAIAHELGAGFVAVRKAGRLPRTTVSEAYQLEYGEAVLEVHADAFIEDQRVLVVDDVLATGGTAEATLGLVERAGGRVAGFSVLLELAFLKGRERLDGRPVHALLTV